MIRTQRITNHILRAVIDRPKALNAINFKTIDDLESLIESIHSNEQIRVLILSGAGNESFAAGGDLREFHTITSKDEALKMSQRIQHLFLELEKLPCWSIAFINGNAYGGGVELMLAHDFRVATPDVLFGMTQGRFYLSPGWGGLTRLVEKVGRSKALKWLGKAEVINTKTALKDELIDAVLPGEDAEKELLQWVEPLTKNDRNYIKTLKKGSLRFAQGRLEALAAEADPFADLWVDQQHITRVENFLNKQK